MRMGSLFCRQMIKCLGGWEAGWEMVTWMGGWWQVQTILVARNTNLTATSRGVGSSCEAMVYDLADTQASWRLFLAWQRVALLPSLEELGLCSPQALTAPRVLLLSVAELPFSWPSSHPHGHLGPFLPYVSIKHGFVRLFAPRRW